MPKEYDDDTKCKIVETKKLDKVISGSENVVHSPIEEGADGPSDPQD